MKELRLFCEFEQKWKTIITDDEDLEFVKRLNPKFMIRPLNSSEGKALDLILPAGGNKRSYFIKHLLVGLPKRGHVVEAKNGNNLDLRKDNLIQVPRSVSIHHSVNRKNKSSRYRGVYKLKAEGENPWASCIRFQGQSIHIGVFPTQWDAAVAYNEKARKFYGDAAYQNKKDD